MYLNRQVESLNMLKIETIFDGALFTDHKQDSLHKVLFQSCEAIQPNFPEK